MKFLVFYDQPGLGSSEEHMTRRLLLISMVIAALGGVGVGCSNSTPAGKKVRDLQSTIGILSASTMHDAYAANNITISGKVVTSDQSPSRTFIQIFSPGDPVTDNDPQGSNWQRLGEGSSDKDTGNYSITIDSGTSDQLVVAVKYASPWYFVLKRVTINQQTSIGNIDFTLPTQDSNVLSIEVRIFVDGQEIDYDNRSYTLISTTKEAPSQGRAVTLGNGNFRIEDNKFFDLPNGQYRILCSLISDDAQGTSLNKTVDVTLPLGTQDKFVDINIITTP